MVKPAPIRKPSFIPSQINFVNKVYHTNTKSKNTFLSCLIVKKRNIHPEISLLCESQALTGLRFSEMVALQNQEYARSHACIHITTTLSNVKGTKTLTRNTAKNVYSIRTVHLDNRAIQIIEDFIKMNKAHKG